MKKKYMLAALAFGLSLSAKVMAQVPNYVPTNGLVGWWPFNGNANDESGNGWVSTGATSNFSSDRFGNANSAFDLTNHSGNISTNYNGILGQNSRTVSLWFKMLSSSGNSPHFIGYGAGFGAGWTMLVINQRLTIDNSNSAIQYNPQVSLNVWHMFTVTYDLSFGTNTLACKVYLDGNLLTNIFSNYNGSQTLNTAVGNPVLLALGSSNCIMDDVAIWNRVLTTCEMQDLYNSQLNSSAGSISVSPQSASVGSNVSLSTTSTSSNLQWQTNGVNLGWQNVPSNSTYSGGTTNTLTANNVQLSNHNQPFRLIASNGSCSDTSDIATIQITDTCITNVTVYDTLYTTVTDTLIINTTLGLPAPNNENVILIYPNPASDHITIDNGNYSAMAGYSIKITNNAGQQVFQSLINQAQFYVDLSTWTGNGLYFVHLLDAQNNTVTIRKIVLQ
jgi:hypothetical protein